MTWGTIEISGILKAMSADWCTDRDPTYFSISQKCRPPNSNGIVICTCLCKLRSLFDWQRMHMSSFLG